MNTLISNFIDNSYTSVQADLLNSITQSLSNIYVDYDPSLLEEIILDEDAEQSSVADQVLTVLRQDAITVLLVHGIATVPDVSLQTLDMLLQYVNDATNTDDIEDDIAILQGSDSVFAIATLAHQTAVPPVALEGYSMETCLVEIEWVKAFLIQHLLDALTGKEPAESVLPERVVSYVQEYSGSIVADMLTPPAALFVGESVDLYHKIFTPTLQDASSEDLVIITVGILMISNLTTVEEMTDEASAIISSYRDPHDEMVLMMTVTNILYKLGVSE